jgi:hypothetical protein
MKNLFATALLACAACGGSTPATSPATAPSSSSTASVETAPVATPAPAPAPEPAAVSSEITAPNVVAPDQVIAGLRPKFNTCYQTGLKKDPKLEGSVTLSAKIEKDGKVSAVTPKNTSGLNPAVIKCLTDHVKAASFAAAGGVSYTTSLDIPVGFSSH